MTVRLMRSLLSMHVVVFFFFFNDTATTEIYTLSLHDALPISSAVGRARSGLIVCQRSPPFSVLKTTFAPRYSTCASTGERSEEHTSELQSRPHLVCRLLLEIKKI